MPATTPPGDDEPRIPRYTKRPLPSYPYRPGRSPHPRRDPCGHSYGAPEPVATAWAPEQWRNLEPWLYAVDLFNARYWWECHEQLEALWKAAGKKSVPAGFVRGIIQIAAACLHRACAKEASAIKQARAGLALIDDALHDGRHTFIGVDLNRWIENVQRWIQDPEASPLRLELDESSTE